MNNESFVRRFKEHLAKVDKLLALPHGHLLIRGKKPRFVFIKVFGGYTPPVKAAVTASESDFIAYLCQREQTVRMIAEDKSGTVWLCLKLKAFTPPFWADPIELQTAVNLL